MTSIVTAVVADILGLAEVPSDVSVFELGASSVATAGICARLEQQTGVKVQITQVFRTPTVARLAGWLEDRQAGASMSNGAVAPAAPDGLVALTPMQAAGAGMGVLCHYSWWLDGPLDGDVLRRAAADVHRRHQALWARYVTSGPAVGYAMIPPGPSEPRFRSLPEAGADAAAVEALRPALLAPLRIEDGEVWRLVLVRSRPSGRRLLAIACDHTAFDNVSAGIVASELGIAYRARAGGRAPDFGPPAASLAEIGAEYAAQLAAADTDAQREYWLSELDGIQPCHLPGRSPAEGLPDHGPLAECPVTFTPGELRAWRRYGQARGMPVFAWMAAAYARALADAGAPADLGLVFGFPNRGSDLVHRSVTCRTIFAMLRPGGPARGGGNLLARTHDAYLQAMANVEGWPDDDEIPALRALPRIAVTEGPVRTLKLGDDVISTPGPELREAGTGAADLVAGLEYGTASDDVLMKIAVRADRYPPALAGQLGAAVGEIIRGGPELLERQTAS